MPPLKPPPLRPGDRVAVIAPSGPFDLPAFETGLALLRRRYHVTHAPDIFARARYLAGDDTRRARELQDALDDDAVGAIFCARGGYGAMRLLPRLVLGKAKPKHLVGFSDVTALHAWLLQSKRVCLHAPVLTQLGRQGSEVASGLYRWLEDPSPPAPWTGAACFVEGRAEGTLVGGNLSVLTRLLGTRFLPPLDGALLFLEDVGERPYRLDRMWTHLALAGVFERVRGLVLGTFTDCDDKDASALEVLRDLAKETGLPCAQGFSSGHSDPNHALALGIHARLDATSGTLTFLEGAVA